VGPEEALQKQHVALGIVHAACEGLLDLSRLAAPLLTDAILRHRPFVPRRTPFTTMI
jgi:hypothetical protein